MQKFLYMLSQKSLMKKEDRWIIAILAVMLAISFFLDPAAVNYVQNINLDLQILSYIISYPAMVFALAAVSFFFWKKRMKKEIIPLWTGPFIGAVLSVLLKWIIRRQRFFLDKFYLGTLPNYSFPSSHATIAFAVLPVLIYKTRNIQWIWAVYGIIILASRVLLKQHYLSDAVGGAFAGYLTGIAVIYLLEKRKII